MIVRLFVFVGLMAGVANAQEIASPTPAAPAPTRVHAGDKMCVDGDDDVRSMVQSAFVKKAVPVTLLASCEGALFIMKIPHFEQHTDKTAVKVTRMLLLGGVSGDNFQMDATVSNKDGVIVYAKTVKRRDSKVASQDLAKWFGEFVKTGKVN